MNSGNVPRKCIYPIPTAITAAFSEEFKMGKVVQKCPIRKNRSLALDDLGAPGYTCDAELMKPSKKIPTNVNSVRPADIKVVMALGDSLTAANGAGAEDPLGVVLQYRGLAFQAGGDKTLDEHATIPNILRKYNPNLFGYSNGIGSPNVWEVAKLNVAMPGAEAKDLPGQAQQLVGLLQTHPEIT
ncbi:hypothetical protein TELCIR_05447 [Teladorsagia circumcincta]|uniref:Triacylglycerol lipase n=1 Tax=Teladorsagia circumcincta TaxID=45464 RepID=A0A2G9UQX1_TELCI|nr:hypothetical protein TELCIR_05447 [Teladorsagia circumcincta]